MASTVQVKNRASAIAQPSVSYPLPEGLVGVVTPQTHQDCNAEAGGKNDYKLT